ncbi:MAG TPA: uroporphyrinogen-III C-methyltransferase [Blastocatellia bacterium]
MIKPDGSGLVYLIGAGPGDPGLLTIKGAQAIAASDVVIYDYLVHPDILSHAKPGAELIYAGKQGGVRSIAQEEINRLLIDRAVSGLTVARLKGGDPFVFGRGGEEAEALADAGIEWEIVPGVSSGVAAPAYAGIPITHRDYSSSVSFITGHNGRGKQRPPIDWPSIACQADTLVIFMCAGAVAEIAAGLIAGGRPQTTPMAVIRWGSYQHQEVYIGTLQDALNPNRAVSSPAIAIVGEVVNLRERLRWFGSESEFQLAAELPLQARMQPELQNEARSSLLEAAKS